MIDGIFSMFKILFAFLKYPLYFVLACFGLFFFSICINIVLQLSKGKRFPKNEGKKTKKVGILRRLFVDTPHQFVLDMLKTLLHFYIIFEV